MRRALLGLGLILFAVFGPPAAAQEDSDAPELVISQTYLQRYPVVSMVVETRNFEGGVDPSDLVFTENGVPISEDQILEVGTIGQSEVPVGVVLVIDASNSMRGEPIDEAKRAALAFVEQKRPEDYVAIVTFSGSPSDITVLPFTTDQRALEKEIESISLRRGTPLYDAVVTAADLYTNAPGLLDPNAIVLSDGADTNSESTLDQAIEAALGQGMRIFSVALQGEGFDPAPLQEMAQETGGRYMETTDPSALTGLFSELQAEISSQLVARFTATESDSTEVTFGVEYQGLTATETVMVPGYVVTTVTPTVAPTFPPPSVQVPQRLPASPFTLRVLVALAVFTVVVMLVLVLAWGREEEDRLGGRLQVYGRREGRPPAEEGGILSRLPLFRSISEQAEAVAQRRGLLGGLNAALESGNILLKPGEAIAAAFGLAVVAGGLVAVWQRSLLWGAIVFVIAVLTVLWWVHLTGRQERKRFEEQLPDTLTLMATSLRAGYSLVQSIEAVAGEAPNPSGREFGRAVAETRLGRPVVQAMQGIAERMKSQDFRWTVMAIEIQREVGGNLSEVLQTVADTMLSRNRLRGEVKALTAEGRISAIVLISVPFLLFGFLVTINPGYLQPLLQSVWGPFAIAVGGLLLLLGAFWLRRIINIRV